MSLLNLLSNTLCFMFWSFECMWILVPWPGIEHAAPGLEDEVSNPLTTRKP